MALPKFEDFKAPWEIDLKEGDEPTFDFDKGKKYLYGVLSDKEKAQNERDAIKAERDTVKAERDTLKSEKEAKEREGETAEQRAIRERDEAREELRKAKEKGNDDGGVDKATIAEIRFDVALEKGLTKAQASRLRGNTKEELEADADDLLKSFGAAGDGEEDPEDDGPRGRPRRQFKNASDPKEGQGKEPDVDDVVAGYVSGRTGIGS